MTILQSLAAMYRRLHRRGDVPGFGWDRVPIGWPILLDANGKPKRPLRQGDPEKSPRGQLFTLPAPVKKTSGISPNFLWEKPAYALGVIAEDVEQDGKKTIRPGQGRRTAEEHEAFRQHHLSRLADQTDPGLVALRRFYERWTPARFEELRWPVDMLVGDLYISFLFRDELTPDDSEMIAARPAARDLVERYAEPDGENALCLVTGVRAPVARVHPSIKGVLGAQSFGADIVSFNLSAVESFGRKQGMNAPVSEHAAAQYTSALNWLLGRGNDTPRRLRFRHGHTPKKNNRLNHFRTGDATVVFWAEDRGADGEIAAQTAEELLLLATEPSYDPDNDSDKGFAEAFGSALNEIRQGRPEPWKNFEGADRVGDVRLHVLGLSPNNARLAPRFWLADRTEALLRHVAEHAEDIRLEPKPFRRPPSVNALLNETAVSFLNDQGKRTIRFETIPPRLAGETVRSILTGARYPRTLLSAVIGRIRADKIVSGGRVALAKAVVNRDLRLSGAPDERSIPVGLDPDNTNPAYLLGRLFAAFEYAETSLATRNATIRDKYIGSASATPKRAFPILMRGFEHNFSALKKAGGKKLASAIRSRKVVEEVMALMDAKDPFPPALRLEGQALFFVGFHQQSSDFFKKKEEAEKGGDE